MSISGLFDKGGRETSTGLDLVKETSEKVDLIRNRLLTAQSRQKIYADRWRRPLEFEVGDHVFLKVMPKRGVVRFDKQGKLSHRYIGPFEVLEMVGYSHVPVGVTARFIRGSCGIPCLYALEVNSKFDSHSRLSKACC